MKSVGIKVLKNKLSSYLKAVRQGEVVLITDRDQVIAEIRQVVPSSDSALHQFFSEAQANGELTVPRSSPEKQRLLSLPSKPPQPVDLEALLKEVRQDRF